MPSIQSTLVAAVVVELVMIAHVDCCVVVPVAAAAAAATDVDCTAADFVDPPVAFVVSVWSKGMTAL